MKPYDCIIIGGGPAGLFCGANIRRPKRGRVMLLEKNRTLGKKLLISGSGRCNITHSGSVHEFLKHYHGAAKFMKPSISAFSNSDLTGFLNKNGIPTVESEGGKIFPESMSSADILKLLIDKCGGNGCELNTGEAVTAVSCRDGLFRVSTSGDVYETENLVIAAGGKSYPATGSSGDGYRLLELLGHSVTTVSPALTPFFIKDYKFGQLSGISVPVSECSLLRESRSVAAVRGDILFTHKGLSGPAVLDISRYAIAGDSICFSLVAMKEEELRQDFIERSRSDGGRSIKVFLKYYDMPERLIMALLQYCGILPDRHASEITKQERQRLMEAMRSMKLEIESKGGYNVAMVTTGGASRDMINPRSMESLSVPGLYLAGEVMDVDGDTGGYNLQAAFSTGMCAAAAVSAKFAAAL